MARERPRTYTRAEQQALLRTARFSRIRETNVTDEYLRILRARFDANERHARSLRRSMGKAEFERQQSERLGSIESIEAGRLRRSLFVAERSA